MSQLSTFGNTGSNVTRQAPYVFPAYAIGGTAVAQTLTLSGGTYTAGYPGVTATAGGGTPFAATDVGRVIWANDNGAGTYKSLLITAYTSSTVVTVTVGPVGFASASVASSGWYMVAPNATVAFPALATGGISFSNGSSYITRAAGNWLYDGVVVGSTITISGDTVNPTNNGTYLVTTAAATNLTVTPAPAVTETANCNLTCTWAISKDSTGIAADKFAVLPTSAFTLGARGFTTTTPFLPGEKIYSGAAIASASAAVLTPGVLTRASGSNITDAVAVGDRILVSGDGVNAANNGIYTVTSVISATQVAVSPTPPVNESNNTSIVMVKLATGSTTTGTTLVATGVALGIASIVATGANYQTSGVIPGSQVLITGAITPANNGVYTVGAVTSATSFVPVNSIPATAGAAVAQTATLGAATGSTTFTSGGGTPFASAAVSVGRTITINDNNTGTMRPVVITAWTSTTVVTVQIPAGVTFASTSVLSSGWYYTEASIAETESVGSQIGIWGVNGTAKVSSLTQANATNPTLRVKAITGYANNTAFASGNQIFGNKSGSFATLGTPVMQTRSYMRQDPSAPFITGTGNITLNTSGTITAATALATLGVAVGSVIQVIGASANNNQIYTVTAMSASGLVATVTPLPGTSEGPLTYAAGTLGLKGHRYNMQLQQV